MLVPFAANSRSTHSHCLPSLVAANYHVTNAQCYRQEGRPVPRANSVIMMVTGV